MQSTGVGATLACLGLLWGCSQKSVENPIAAGPGGAGGEAASELGGTGGQQISDPGLEGPVCRDGKISFGSCPLGCHFSTCDPVTSGGVECVPSGPCPGSGDPSSACSAQETQSDPVNCGVCGKACAPSVVAALPSSALLADAKDLFVADQHGALTRIELASGAVTSLRSGDAQSGFPSIASDATSVYLAHEREAGVHELLQIARAGGPATVLFSGTNPIVGLAVDGTYAYWAELTGSVVRKVRVNAAAEQPVTLASGRADSSASSLALNATKVYWTTSFLTDDAIDGAVMSTSLDGGAATVVAQGFATALAADDTSVYWIAQGALYRAPAAGGTPVQLVSNAALADALAVDDTNVYWTSGGLIWNAAEGFYESAMMWLPLAGGTPAVLARQQNLAGAFAVAQSGRNSVYWAVNSTASSAVNGPSILRSNSNVCQDGVCR